MTTRCATSLSCCIYTLDSPVPIVAYSHARPVVETQPPHNSKEEQLASDSPEVQVVLAGSLAKLRRQEWVGTQTWKLYHKCPEYVCILQGLEEDEGGGDPEVVFKREVVETLLRTMLLAKESESAKTSMMENAVIELNALKIAGAVLVWFLLIQFS